MDINFKLMKTFFLTQEETDKRSCQFIRKGWLSCNSVIWIHVFLVIVLIILLTNDLKLFLVSHIIMHTTVKLVYACLFNRHLWQRKLKGCWDVTFEGFVFSVAFKSEQKIVCPFPSQSTVDIRKSSLNWLKKVLFIKKYTSYYLERRMHSYSCVDSVWGKVREARSMRIGFITSSLFSSDECAVVFISKDIMKRLVLNLI